MGRISLAGAPVLVTGASSGIGRAVAAELAARGARLAIAARRTALLEEAADAIAAAGAPRPVVLAADLARPGAADALARDALAALGGVRVLVNNAGAGLVAAQGEAGDGAEARALFETNFWAPLALTRRLLPALRAERGTVVNVTSSLQAVPVPLLGHYGASKAALAHATRTLRHELAGTGVTVLEAVPGATDTAARDIDLLPWRDGPMRTPPPVSPESAARAVVTAIEKGRRRRVHPRLSLLPLELPAAGRAVAALVTPRIDTARG
ncbi:SDR family NAD(P)-dependent oxidoreductase [Actinomadura parmotrematis]|uniref:SDR family NAD(P)-dependent oxidoreductase n=1 Tax=Actinomadura parmotrematis TaxID=2864039 RepID=A0ABS7FR09_9ACTN|nr:SDR family NAD(P)-dependent oxidoreductase [Actinomadura parmotrematis]MBW8481973.1 SDR family NAD(P)-dependent oxidoreductase [Actinomadura parmotrematis]